MSYLNDHIQNMEKQELNAKKALIKLNRFSPIDFFSYHRHSKNDLLSSYVSHSNITKKFIETNKAVTFAHSKGIFLDKGVYKLADLSGPSGSQTRFDLVDNNNTYVVILKGTHYDEAFIFEMDTSKVDKSALSIENLWNCANYLITEERLNLEISATSPFNYFYTQKNLSETHSTSSASEREKKKYVFQLPHKIVFLTERELSILKKISEVKPNRIIASELGLSIKTVENYFENLKNKMSISTRWDLAYLYQNSIYSINKDKP